MLGITLESHSNTPLHRQLYEQIRQRILEKQLTPDTRLAPSRELASQLNISRNTVLQALHQLETEGYVYTKLGSGVFVAAHIPDDYLKTETIKHNNNPSIKHSQLSLFSKRVLKLMDNETLSNRLFATGLPAMEDMLSHTWLKLWHKQLRNTPLSLLSQNTAAGYIPLQKALSKYLSYSRAVNCKPQQVLITHGAQQALDLICRALIDKKDIAVIEEPGYLGIRNILTSLGAHIIPCLVDTEGIHIKTLNRLKNKTIRVIYTTPTHQFPLGGIMPISARLELLAWAKQHNAYIIEDDYDSEFHYTAKPLPSLYSLDTDNRVLYVGSFSKVLTPLIRTGYLVTPPHLTSLLTKIKRIATGNTDLIKQSVLAEYINEGHFVRHLKRSRILYANKMNLLVKEIEKHLNPWVTIEHHHSGMHLVLLFRNTWDDQAIVKKLAQVNISCKAISSFYFKNPKKTGLILGFSHMTEKEIVRGISIIHDVLLNFKKN